MVSNYLNTTDEAMGAISKKIEEIRQKEHEESLADQALETAKRRLEEKMKMYEEMMARRKAKRTSSTPEPRQESEHDLGKMSEHLSKSTTKEEHNVVDRLSDSIATKIKTTNRRRIEVEPAIFKGDVLQFTEWETDLDD